MYMIKDSGNLSISWISVLLIRHVLGKKCMGWFTPLCRNPIRLGGINILADRLSRSMNFSKKKIMIVLLRVPPPYFSYCPTIDFAPECNSIFKTLPFRVIMAPFMCSGYIFI